MRISHLIFALGFFAASTLRVPGVLGAGATDSVQSWYLILESPSLAQASKAAEPGTPQKVRSDALAARSVQIRAQQEAVGVRLRALGVIEAGRFQKLVNVIRVRAPASQVEQLRQLPGVKDVQPVHRHQRLCVGSVPYIGAPMVWTNHLHGADGSGVRVGIIDTGIDYLHADFGGPGTQFAYESNDRTTIASGTFPTAKVAGGWDFAGDDYNPDAFETSMPDPDPNPLDCYGHGTHVAGIVAGFGVLTNKATYKGSYTNGVIPSQFMIGPGVAPKAKLYALKIFGCQGSTELMLEGLEWACDPNGDGNFSDRLDVVNISVGSDFGSTSSADPEVEAINRLADLGCVVAVAAGNSGNTFYIAGAPANAEKCLSVASTIDNARTSVGIDVLSPSSIAHGFDAIEGSCTKPIAEIGFVEAPLVYVTPNDACGTLSNPASVKGKIALIDRGNCYFTDKIQRVQDAGAVGVLMVNNTNTAPIIMGGTPTSPIQIPGFMISLDDGAILKMALKSEAVRVRFSVSTGKAHPEWADTVSDFSSRGPASPDNRLKPDLAAPGDSIVSASFGTGNLGVLMSGTSMATPHVAGAAALLVQLHRDWSPVDIKAALMNTAKAARDESGNAYPESRVGAGRIQVDAAGITPVTVQANDGTDFVGLSFGMINASAPLVSTQSVILHNHGSVPVTYSVVVSNSLSTPGANLTMAASQVTVPAGGSVIVPAMLAINPTALQFPKDPTTPATINGTARQRACEASGQIWFLGGPVPIHLPWYAVARADSDAHVSIKDLALPAPGATVSVRLPVSGNTRSTQSLVSVFQLGALEKNSSLQPYHVIAAGAASDAATQTSFANSKVYFGIVTQGDHGSPQSFLGAIEVLIDTDGDGVAERKIISSSMGNIEGTDLYDSSQANDIMASAVEDPVTGSWSVGMPANLFDADIDTALFNNNVIVLGAPVNVLGLSSGQSKFRYSVSILLADTIGYGVVGDSTDWVAFDAAKPAIRATGGVNGWPMFRGGSAIDLAVDTAAAGADGAAQTSALILHHFNDPLKRADIVNFHFAPNDSTVPLKIYPLASAGNRFGFQWTSRPNQNYSVMVSTNLNAGFTIPASIHLGGTPPFNTYTEVIVPDSETRFYKVVQE